MFRWHSLYIYIITLLYIFESILCSKCNFLYPINLSINL
jgi:hypothetical protein